MTTSTLQSPEQNALARQPQSAKRELKDWLQGETFKAELRALLPKAMSAERFVRVAFQSIHRNPSLLKCSQESFFNCLLSLGAIGLEPDGRNAHLVPFGQECTLIVDYKGIAQILRRNHDVASIHCDVVYTRDEYEAEQGTNQHLRHVKARGERGEPILAYSFVRLPDGSQEFEEMTISEIEAIRKRSKTPNTGPWVTDRDAMYRKTVFRKHAKMLPLSPESREALDREMDGDSIAFAEATPVVSAAVVAAPPKRRGRLHKDTLESAPEPPAPPSTATANQSVSDDLPEPINTPLDEQVLAKVEEAGFTEAEILAVLKEVRLVDQSVTALREATGRALQMTLDEWENALRRLKENKAKATPKQ